jgi:hypothetical protein
MLFVSFMFSTKVYMCFVIFPFVLHGQSISATIIQSSKQQRNEELGYELWSSSLRIPPPFFCYFPFLGLFLLQDGVLEQGEQNTDCEWLSMMCWE